MRRMLVAPLLALLVLAGAAGMASAHPLGNYTVNRALALTVAPGRIAILYVLDMAEIPTFSEIARIDLDGDEALSPTESSIYASEQCESIRAAVRVQVDDSPVPLGADAAPELSFPDGAGGLRTLRLACRLRADLAAPAGRIVVADPIDDGHVGWREIIIGAAAGVRLTESDAPATSTSALLTSYPTDLLQTPPDLRRAQARFAPDGTASGAIPVSAGTSLLAPTAGDPLGTLLEGDLSPAVVLLGLIVAAGLGAAHALSPGHGKALVAAYLIGSRGTARQAIALGLTVAATHTAGVLVLGATVLLAGELLLPEVVIGWLTILSGGLMVILGAGLLWRALSGRRTGGNAHPHPHSHGRGAGHVHPLTVATPCLSVRSVALLGMAGGLVPSASALIVLLAAVSTGRLVFGVGLIAAFGIGMAGVLGGLAVAATVARRWFTGRATSSNQYLRLALGVAPICSGLLVLGIGLAVAISAVSRLG
jgi:nickel/cobalt exporter